MRRWLQGARNGWKLGRALKRLGFEPALGEKCANCGKHRILKRAFTGEYWCVACKWGTLYPGTLKREEVAWFFDGKT